MAKIRFCLISAILMEFLISRHDSKNFVVPGKFCGTLLVEGA